MAEEFWDNLDAGMAAARLLAARFPDDKKKAGNIARFEDLENSIALL